jgi:hypothetical protein
VPVFAGSVLSLASGPGSDARAEGDIPTPSQHVVPVAVLRLLALPLCLNIRCKIKLLCCSILAMQVGAFLDRLVLSFRRGMKRTRVFAAFALCRGNAATSPAAIKEES